MPYGFQTELERFLLCAWQAWNSHNGLMYAIQQSFSLAAKCGLFSILVESDSQRATTFINHWMNLELLFSFAFAPQTNNMVAHSIARFTTSVGSKLVWLEDEVLLGLHDLLVHDL
ncbi:conserved hypothetical protein [Ricinus communis]|uniref:Uncharacterized protein n=1 Tax=Ricinus communis TaxID=3988 RepID=B9S7E8_RICCO|nr:conserved hypothetical protein [Ricinus communis]